MSRIDAVAALRREATTGLLVTAMGWVSPELLGEIAEQAEASAADEAVAAAAAALAVDAAFVNARDPHARETVTALHAGDIAAIWAVEGVFSRVAETTGWAEALRMTAAEPGAISGRLDESLHDALVDVRQAFEAEADAVLIADDLSSASGPLISPDYVLDALMPCYHRLAVEAVGGGMPAVFHSDGEIRVLFPALARAGFSAVHVAVAGPDAFAASALAAHRVGLVVLGGIAASALGDGARDAGERAAATASSLGGVIVADDGGLTSLVEYAALGAALGFARDAFKRLRD